MARLFTVAALFVSLIQVVAAPEKSLMYEGTIAASDGSEVYQLPDLPFAEDALKDAIDQRTVQVHYGAHHIGYKNKMNAALADWRSKDKAGFDKLVGGSRNLIYMFNHLKSVPQEYYTKLKNVGGGYVNHIFYWSVMSGSPTQTPDKLSKEINQVFGSLDKFKQEFTKQAASLFGSGYVWLVRDEDNKLEVISLPNQESPISLGKKPIFTIDVWEHAYYLMFQNKRTDYIAKWWTVVDWSQIEKLDAWWSKIKLDQPTNSSMTNVGITAVGALIVSCFVLRYITY